MQSELSHTVINYVWNIGDDIAWFIDKIYKSDLVIFDADHSGAELIHGWIVAHPQSYYFGNLRDLHLVNDRAILHSDQLITILETVSKHYE
jgi:hypothetical protein